MSAGRTRAMKLAVRHVGTSAVVRVIGSANMNEAQRLRETLEALAAGKARRIVVDLSEMDFISSVGLGAIISAHLKCRHHQGRIFFVNPQPAVAELLETTRLTKLFPIYDDVEEALSA